MFLVPCCLRVSEPLCLIPQIPQRPVQSSLCCPTAAPFYRPHHRSTSSAQGHRGAGPYQPICTSAPSLCRANTHIHVHTCIHVQSQHLHMTHVQQRGQSQVLESNSKCVLGVNRDEVIYMESFKIKVFVVFNKMRKQRQNFRANKNTFNRGVSKQIFLIMQSQHITQIHSSMLDKLIYPSSYSMHEPVFAPRIKSQCETCRGAAVSGGNLHL